MPNQFTGLIKSNHNNAVVADAVAKVIASSVTSIYDNITSTLYITGYSYTIDGKHLALGIDHPHRNIAVNVYKLIVAPGDWTIYAPMANISMQAVIIDLYGSLTIDTSAEQAINTITDGKSWSHGANSGVSCSKNGDNGKAGKRGENGGSIYIETVTIQQ